MEDELKTTINTEIADDMPDFEENTAEMPCESAESVDECTDDAENAIVSEENEGEAEESKTETKEKKLSPYEKAILAEMERRAEEGDELLADALKSKDKSIQRCFAYVTEQARKKAVGRCAMIEDAVVFGWAHHYYIESNETLEAEKPKPKPAPKQDTAKKGAEKGKEKPKPVGNTLDLSKVISAKLKDETGKKKRREKKKENMLAGFIPMERPDTLKEAKKGSREQAKSVTQGSLFSFDD